MSIYGRYACIFLGLLLFVPLLIVLHNDAAILLLALLGVGAFGAACIGGTMIAFALTVPIRPPKPKHERSPS